MGSFFVWEVLVFLRWYHILLTPSIPASQAPSGQKNQLRHQIATNFFVLALIFWPCIFIIRPVFSVKIQVYHILLRYRHVESHFHDVLLLSLRTPFFIASLSAQIACNSHTPVTLYATFVASQRTLASWTVLPSLERLVRGINVRVNGHCVKRPKQCWNLINIPLKIFWLFSAEKWGTYLWGLRYIPWCQRTPTVVQPTSPPFFCYIYFVYRWASIILAAIFITRPVFFVKIQGYHILLRYRYVESHSYHVVLLSLQAPFFVASLSAQMAYNSQI